MACQAILEVLSADTREFVFKPKRLSCKALMPFLGGNFLENKNQLR